MALELRQQVKLSQQLVMTPQLQQAIKLLQLSRLELAETIQQEIEQNPMLDETPGDYEPEAETAAGEPEQEPIDLEKTSEVRLEENSTQTLSEINWEDYANEYESGFSTPGASGSGREESDLPSRLDILSKKPDLQSHLRWQLSFANLTEEETEIANFIVGNLNRDGFLDVDEEEIGRATGAGPETVARVLALVQDLDPAGIAARNVKESLLLQLEKLGLGGSLAATIVRDHIHFLETKNYAAIAKATGQATDKVLAAVKVIINLDPFPGRVYSDEEPHYIVPDVYVHKLGDEYVILLNDEGLPRLRLNSYYREILKKSSAAPEATREYIQDKLKSAVWLIKSIQQRQRTIYRVVESIIKFQRNFFEKGVAHLRPLVLRDVAEDIGMHESTISRVTSSKYVHTPQGTYELKYFFNSAISQIGGEDLSSESIKNRLRQIVQAENPEKPLSDKAIAEIFEKEDIQLARRTVAKYREQLGILPSKYRKKPKL
ncbi:MAG: RNA polymerase factor sigma-54 [Desulfobacteraceae bacterium]|nr:RNA polymerase factor sigma-54 [Desulfobacteraceae bacterium]